MVPGPTLCTWCQQDDGGDDQRADDQNDKEGDRYSLPVPLRRVAAHQLLQTEERRGQKRRSTDTGKKTSTAAEGRKSLPNVQDRKPQVENVP